MEKESLAVLIKSIKITLERLTSEKVAIARPCLIEDGFFNTEYLTITVRITGNGIVGNMVLLMDENSAIKLAGRMMDKKLRGMNSDARSALMELSNMISANALASLSNEGHECDIKIPTIMIDKNEKILFGEDEKAISVPISLGWSHITAIISFGKTGPQ